MPKGPGPLSSGPQEQISATTILSCATNSIATRLHALFQGSSKAHGLYMPTEGPSQGKQKGKASTLTGPATVEHWQAHLGGREGLGVVPLLDNSTCVWGAVDLDVYDLKHGQVAALVVGLGLPAMVARSRSGGAHVLLFASEPVPAEQMQARLAEVAAALGHPDAELFPAQVDPTKCGGNWVNAPYWNGDATTRYAVTPDGQAQSVADFVDRAERMKNVTGPDWFSTPLRLPNAPASAPVKPRRKSGFMLPETITEGGRDKTLASMAGTMRRVGASQDVILAALQQLNRQCDPPLTDAQVEKIARSVARYKPGSTQAQFPLTELGNAERFGAEHGADVRYCAAQKLWYLWNSQRWNPDATQTVKALAMKMVRRLFSDAADIPDKEERKAMLKHACVSQSDSRVRGMLALASAFQDIAVTVNRLDADPWVLNVENGTVDLRTGQLRDHRQEDLITKMCPVHYDPNATHEMWDAYLRTVTGDSQEVMAFLQRAVGYSLTGDVSEEKLFFVHGPAASGKSTFLESVRAMLGDYSRVADFETFLQRSFTGGPRNDVAHLAGSRFVVSIEVDEGKRLAQGLVKTLTGGDAVTARFLHANLFTFRPTFKLWLAANDAPQVNDDDEAMWRRILRVPFDYAIPEGKRDPRVKTVLRSARDAGPAILAWAVKGCVAWQKHGLDIPAAIKQATNDYRHSMDPLQEFFTERCVFASNATVTSAKLYEAYLNWAAGHGIKDPMKKTGFGRRLAARNCESKYRKDGGQTWFGIGLLADGFRPDVLF